jgi:hypothetical protein
MGSFRMVRGLDRWPGRAATPACIRERPELLGLGDVVLDEARI